MVKAKKQNMENFIFPFFNNVLFYFIDFSVAIP